MIYNETIIRNYFYHINVYLIDILSIRETKMLDIDIICVNMNRININDILVEDELYINKILYTNELRKLRKQKIESI
ncbi:hypothetical protein M0Q50_03270 [bacterium]|jgi:hypothetical protein|nr:hypothetical protein [bacterium]